MRTNRDIDYLAAAALAAAASLMIPSPLSAQQEGGAGAGEKLLGEEAGQAGGSKNGQQAGAPGDGQPGAADESDAARGDAAGGEGNAPGGLGAGRAEDFQTMFSDASTSLGDGDRETAAKRLNEAAAFMRELGGEDNPELGREAQRLSDYAQSLGGGTEAGAKAGVNRTVPQVAAQAQSALSLYYLGSAGTEANSQVQGEKLASAALYAKQALKNAGFASPESEESGRALDETIAAARKMAEGGAVTDVQRRDLVTSTATQVRDAAVSVRNVQTSPPDAAEDTDAAR